jgi:hypothetical protein
MRHAVFTIVQDEPVFFPLWYRYYSRHYKPQNIYVLYHPLFEEESGGEPTWLKVPLFNDPNTRTFRDMNIVRVFREKSFDHTWLRAQVEQFAAFLLGSHDTVTFTEVDEILALDPYRVNDGSLMRWLAIWCRQRRPAVRATGYEVVHQFDDEPDLDLDEIQYKAGRVLRDRGWWYPSEIYSKTLIWTAPPQWDNGFHEAFIPDGAGAVMPLVLGREPELLLLHLHKVDYCVAAARLRRTAARDWNKPDTRDRVGIQNRFTSEAQLKNWWYKSIDHPAANAPLVQIPDDIRSII